MSWTSRVLLIALIAFASALAGVFIGRAIVNRQAAPENALHVLLHDRLDLDARQTAQLELLEKQFAIRKRALERDMRAENARLAAAIEAEHGYGTAVSATIDHLHMLMGELQKESLEHVFAMRGLLRPDQARKFDGAVVKALTAPAK